MILLIFFILEILSIEKMIRFVSFFCCKLQKLFKALTGRKVVKGCGKEVNKTEGFKNNIKLESLLQCLMHRLKHMCPNRHSFDSFDSFFISCNSFWQ
jgi:hypothetical protein